MLRDEIRTSALLSPRTAICYARAKKIDFFFSLKDNQ